MSRQEDEQPRPPGHHPAAARPAGDGPLPLQRPRPPHVHRQLRLRDAGRLGARPARRGGGGRLHLLRRAPPQAPRRPLLRRPQPQHLLPGDDAPHPQPGAVSGRGRARPLPAPARVHPRLPTQSGPFHTSFDICYGFLPFGRFFFLLDLFLDLLEPK